MTSPKMRVTASEAKRQRHPQLRTTPTASALELNTGSESYKIVEHAYKHGTRRNTRGMSADDFKAAILGKSSPS